MLGQCNDVCAGCGAKHWGCERTATARKGRPHVFSKCCQGGAVDLSEIDDAETDLRVAQIGQKLDPVKVKRSYDHLCKRNPYAKVFRSAKEIVNLDTVMTLKLRSMLKDGPSDKRYNRLTANEVAMVIEGDGPVGATSREIILHRKDGNFQRISELHTGYMAMRYPVVFWNGKQGWDEHVPRPVGASELLFI